MQPPPKKQAQPVDLPSRKRPAAPPPTTTAQDDQQRANKRAKARADRNIPVQVAPIDALTPDGEVNLPQFLEALQTSIGGLESAMRRSKASGTKRAFQQVPRDMRRRTASHNPSRVPGRLRDRAKGEMTADNTPLNEGKKSPGDVARALEKAEKARRDLRVVLRDTERLREGILRHVEELKAVGSKGTAQLTRVKAQAESLSTALGKTRKLIETLHGHESFGDVKGKASQREYAASRMKALNHAAVKTKKLNKALEEFKTLKDVSDSSDKLSEALAKTKKLNKSLAKVNKPDDGTVPEDSEDEEDDSPNKAPAAEDEDEDIEMTDAEDLTKPPNPARGKRAEKKQNQLPTHLWHAKRAKMSTIDNPFFSKPTPLNMNAKTVRSIHRAYNSSAIMRDTSHRGFIQLSGLQHDVEAVLRPLGIQYLQSETDWPRGCRVWVGMVRVKRAAGNFEDVAPARAFWNPTGSGTTPSVLEELQRQILIEVEPASKEQILQLLESAVDDMNKDKKKIALKDLSPELGCIDILGPSSTERLLHILQPYISREDDGYETKNWKFFRTLGLVGTSMLGYNISLGLSIKYPDKSPPSEDMSDEDADTDEIEKLLSVQKDWALNPNPTPFTLLDSTVRRKALQVLQLKQNAAARVPGASNQPTTALPVILVCSSSQTDGIDGKWTIVCQRDLVKSIWLRLAGQHGIEVACVEEMHRLHTEQNVPFFPVDFPTTRTGLTWEMKERERLEKEWLARPKGKRTDWKAFKLGDSERGEHGSPFACDWELLLGVRCEKSGDTGCFDKSQKKDGNQGKDGKKQAENNDKAGSKTPYEENHLMDKAVTVDGSLLQDHILHGGLARMKLEVPEYGLFTVSITMIDGGVPNPHSRIYSLPRGEENAELRASWLEQFVRNGSKAADKATTKNGANRRFPESSTLDERKTLLVASLLRGTDSIAAAGGSSGVAKQQQALPVRATDLIGFVTSGGFNLGRGKGKGIGHLGAVKLVASVEAGGRPWDHVESRYCIVRNVGETVARAAVWTVLRGGTKL